MTGGWERGRGWGVVDRPDEGEHGGTLYAAPLATGVIHVLRGPAAVVARAACTGGDLEHLRGAVASDLGTDVDSVDVEALAELLDELTDLGLVRRADAREGSVAR